MAFIIPLIALAVGAGLQAAGAAKARNAMNDRTSAELNRQRKFRQEGKERFAGSLQQSTPERAKGLLQEGEQMSLARSKQTQSVPLTIEQPEQGSTTQVRDRAEMNRGNRARAAVSAQPWWTLNQAIKDIRANQELGTINNFAQGSQAQLPLEIQDASHKGDTLAGIGSLVSMLGSLYGISSIASGAGAASATTAAAKPVAGYGWTGGSYVAKPF